MGGDLNGLIMFNMDIINWLVVWNMNCVFPSSKLFITMENHHAINGKINYFDWTMFQFANGEFTRPGFYLPPYGQW
jgi:hypothetical protein